MLNKKTTEEEVFSRSSAAPSQPVPAAGQNVIVLHDLTSGPEAEVGRLKSRMVAESGGIGSLRNENQSLKAEMREMKLVLSKVQLSELRGLDKVNSWLRSLKRMFDCAKRRRYVADHALIGIFPYLPTCAPQ